MFLKTVYGVASGSRYAPPLVGNKRLWLWSLPFAHQIERAAVCDRAL